MPRDIERTVAGHRSNGPDRAPVNRVFLCLVCGRAFADRAATEHVAVAVDHHIIRVADAAGTLRHAHPTTHEIYGPEAISSGQGEDEVRADVTVPAAKSLPCCAQHTRLADATKARVALDPGGSYVIVGAKFLE